jgi:hypothetical protein
MAWLLLALLLTFPHIFESYKHYGELCSRFTGLLY